MMASSTCRRYLPDSIIACFAVILLPLLWTPESAYGQNSEIKELRKELKELRSVVEEMRSDTKFLRAIFEEVQSRKNPIGPARVQLDDSGLDDPSLGDPKAPLTMYAFLDLQCAFCAKFHGAAFKQIKRDYIDTGKVRFVIRDFFLEEGSPAIPAASFLSCAFQQDKLLPALDTFFKQREAIAEGELSKVTQSIEGLDLKAFDECVHSPRYRIPLDSKDEPLPSREALEDLREASTMQISGTPSFFIFLSGDFNTSAPVTGYLIRGEQSFETFKGILDVMLAGPPSE